MWLRTLDGWTWTGWMSATVSTSKPFFTKSSLISSVSAKMDTRGRQRRRKDTMVILRVHDEQKQGYGGSCIELTLYDYVRFGDRGEASVQRVDLSWSKKTLKQVKELRSKKSNTILSTNICVNQCQP